MLRNKKHLIGLVLISCVAVSPLIEETELGNLPPCLHYTTLSRREEQAPPLQVWRAAVSCHQGIKLKVFSQKTKKLLTNQKKRDILLAR